MLEEVKYYHNNNKLSHHFFRNKNKKVEGIYREYNIDGNIKFTCFVINGIMYGTTFTKFKTQFIWHTKKTINNGIRLKLEY